MPVETPKTDCAAEVNEGAFLAALGEVRRRVADGRKTWFSRERRAPVFYTASSILLSLGQMVGGLVLARWILPREMGLWQSVYIALTYSYILLAGVNNGLSRELPYYSGTGDETNVKSLASTAQLYTEAGCVLALIVGSATVIFLMARRYDRNVVLAVAAVTLLILLNFYRNYLTVTFRSQSSFISLAYNQALEGTLMLASLVLVYYFRYTGMLIRLIVVAGIVVYFMHRARPLKVRSEWSWKSFRTLLQCGVPIFALDYLGNCSNTVDRIALLHFGGVEQVGLYALAKTACTAFEVIPNSVAHYIYPRMSYRYGRDRNPRALWVTCWKTSIVLTTVMLPLAAVGWLCLPSAISVLFPKYVAATMAAQLMLLAAIGTGLSVCTNALWSMKAWRPMTGYQIASASLSAIAPFAGIRLFASPLIGVASGMVLARLVAAVIGLGVTYHATHHIVEPDLDV